MLRFYRHDFQEIVDLLMVERDSAVQYFTHLYTCSVLWGDPAIQLRVFAHRQLKSAKHATTGSLTNRRKLLTVTLHTTLGNVTLW